MNLTQRIRHDLESRIAIGNDLPSRWTLETLAASYQVSLTPVRVAVRELIEAGWLLRGDNGHLISNPERLGCEIPPTPEPIAISTDWESRLSEHILRLSLSGEAMFLREESIAEQMGIGRTMVRQQFSKLAGKGVLEHVPRRGWRLVPFREVDMLAYLEIRETLERKALELAWPRLDPIELQRMHDANLPMPEDPSPRLDNQLHGYFIACADNRYLTAFFATYGGYFSALFDYATLGTDALAEMAAQHRQILAYALAQRPTAAADALAAHIRDQAPNLKRLVEHVRNQ